MRPVSDAAQMRALDASVIDGLGLPGIALMEVASEAVARFVRAHASPTGPIVVLCGPGNNGGDGWATARWLHGWGLPVAVWASAEPSTPDAVVMAQAARAAGVREVDAPGEPAWVVDALFGTGLTRPVRGPASDVIRDLQGCPTVAVDVPSGLHSDTGEALGPVLQAEATVTFGRPKLGMYLRDGPRVCGRIHVRDIGLQAGNEEAAAPTAWLLEASDAALPARHPTGHKRTHGDLLVVAGSAAMAGAAVLACRGALAGGVGLVRLLAPRGAWPRLAQLPPEVMVQDGGDGDVLTELPSAASLQAVDAVVAGPGLAGGEPLSSAVAAGLRRWWTDATTPLLFDADALTCTAALPEGRHPARVLTPHEGEAARLLGTTPREVWSDRVEALLGLQPRGTVLLKGPHTLVGDGRICINPTGHPVLATGGSGDVLAGFVGALLARGLSGPQAAWAGAYWHGRAGEALASRRSDGWRASDIAAELASLPTSAGT